MPDDELDLAGASTDQDPAEGSVEAADAQDLEARPGEPGYVQDRLKRIKGQRDAARREAAEKDGELRAMRDRLASLEDRANQPAQPQEPKANPVEADLKRAREFIQSYEELRSIVLTDSDEERVAKAKEQLRRVRPEDVAFAHEQIADLKALQRTTESERKTATNLDARSAQSEFKERIKQEFGAQYVVKGTPEFEATLSAYRDLIKQFPDDSSGAVTWMALQQARSKQDRAGRGTNDTDRRRLAIEAGVRREGTLTNHIAALEARGDQTSLAKATEMKLDAFLQQRYGAK